MKTTRKKIEEILETLGGINAHTHQLVSEKMHNVIKIYEMFPQVVETQGHTDDKYCHHYCDLADGRRVLISVFFAKGLGTFYRINNKGDMKSFKKPVKL